MSRQRHTYERWLFACDIRADDVVPAAVTARRFLKHMGRAWGIRCQGYSEDAALMELRQENAEMRQLVESLAARVAAQSELLSRAASERSVNDESM